MYAATSSVLSSLLAQSVKNLLESFIDEQWLRQNGVIRRHELKTRLFDYHARKKYLTDSDVTPRDGGIAFPSLEGALISIAFLTCAVFLIDLIQLTLTKLRMKNATQATPAAAAILGREFQPTQSASRYRYQYFHNNTYPISMNMLTTLSSKVLSAIERP